MVKDGQSFKVNAVRSGSFVEVPVDQLVPGDVIEIGNDSIIPADCVLIAGEALVDEAMLTGESVAMTKTPIKPTDDSFDVDKQRLHVLYGGTRILISRTTLGISKAIVLRTGFHTAKGSMIQA